MFLHICINCGTLAMTSTITSAWVDLNLHKKTFITSCTWETFERRQCIKEVGTKTWERLQEGNDLLLLLQEHGADIRCLAPEALEISEGWRRRRLGGGGSLDNSITFHLGKFNSGRGGEGKSVSLIHVQLIFKEKILF